MKNKYDFTLLTLMILAIFGVTCYVTNFVKLTNCDFEPSYKSEAIHSIGVLVPPLSLITVWFDVE